MKNPNSAVGMTKNNLGRFLEFKKIFKSAWQPQSISRPFPSRNFENLGLFERLSETLMYSILLFEYSISPNGGLRAWLRLNLLVGVVGVIPALTIVPVVTYLLHGFTTWSEYIRRISENLLWAVLFGFATLALIVVGGRALVWIARRKF